MLLFQVGLVVGGGYLYLRSRFTGTASSEDSALWEEQLGKVHDDDSSASTVDPRLAKSIMDGE